MIEFDTKESEFGILGLRLCPDCHRPLVSLLKITEEMAITKVRAKVCMNFSCWRFTQIANLMTWKKY